jgi:coproporphyrinogen III oxidase-like Fe-S oxidoreductase
LARPDWPFPGEFGLYVHWPFCQAKCPYCDFNSHVSAADRSRAMAAAYLSEIKRFLKKPATRILRIGLLRGRHAVADGARGVAAILDAARQGWSFANDIEITLEANPTSVEAGRFRAFAMPGSTGCPWASRR